MQETNLTNKGKESLRQIQHLLAPKVSRTAPYSPRLAVDSNVSERDEETDSMASLNSATHLIQRYPRNRSSQVKWRATVLE